MNEYGRNMLNQFCDAGFNHAAQACPVHQPEYAYRQKPLGFGYRIDWRGSGYEVNGCVSYEEARRKCAEFAEMGGLVFRKHWWEFWRPRDPRES